MNDPKSRRRELGRGLAALLGDAVEEQEQGTGEARHQPHTLPIEQLRPSRFQPRRNFAEADIQGLAESIREQGILQPILVRRHPDTPGSYEIVAGERRWRAAQVARLHEVPVIVKDIGDEGVLEIALVENIQRQDLGPLEEAEGFQRLIEEFSHTQEDLAKAVGRSRSHIANTIRLLNLPAKVKTLLDQGALSAGHARALLNAADPEGLASLVVKRGLNVRQTEKLAQDGKKPTSKRKTPAAKDPDTIALEQDLSNMLGLNVSIDFHGKGGRLVINYDSLEQLDDLLNRLTQSPAQEPAASRISEF